MGRSKKQRDEEMKMRVELLKAQHSFMAAVLRLHPIMENISSHWQSVFVRVACEAAELLNMNIDNDF